MTGKTVGILGGLGPLATAYFMELVIHHTVAARDQDHIDMVVSNHATIPDRTDFILGRSPLNPLGAMIGDAKKLEAYGVDFVVMPCNTASFFFDEIRQSIGIAMVNIVEEAVRYARETVPGLSRLGILATDGTILSGTYDQECSKQGITAQHPTDAQAQVLMHIIYDEVKAGRRGNTTELLGVIDAMLADGCTAVVLGCTELSTMCQSSTALRAPGIIDSLYALARRTILLAGKDFRE